MTLTLNENILMINNVPSVENQHLHLMKASLLCEWKFEIIIKVGTGLNPTIQNKAY